VCKKWNQILSDNSLWRHVDLTEYRLDLKAIWKLVRYHLSPSLLTLKIQCYAYADSNSKGRALVSKALLRELSTRCPNLRLLHLNECKMNSIPFKYLPPSTTCLDMVCSRWKSRWMKDKQMHLPNLQQLSLVLSGQMNDFDIGDIATFAKHLTELEVLNLILLKIDDSAVQYIALHLKKLQKLRFVHCHSITDRAVISIAEGLPALNMLDISYCPRITMRGLKSLFVCKLSVLIVGREYSLSEKKKQILKTGFPENFVLIA
ncbi:unnamed protein product, partial [Candidula unifasciata]